MTPHFGEIMALLSIRKQPKNLNIAFISVSIHTFNDEKTY